MKNFQYIRLPADIFINVNLKTAKKYHVVQIDLN